MIHSVDIVYNMIHFSFWGNGPIHDDAEVQTNCNKAVETNCNTLLPWFKPSDAEEIMSRAVQVIFVRLV